MRRVSPIAGLLVVVVLLSARPSWAQQITITDLPLIGDAHSNSVLAINNIGDAVGVSVHAAAPVNRAAVWRNHVGSELDLGCGACQSTASDINDAGDIVGTILSPAPGRGFLWQNGVTTLLPPLPGDTTSVARGINNFGIVVGQSSGAAGSRPVRWVNGVPEDLGVLGSNGPSFGNAEAISDSGIIVGQTSVTGQGNQAFRWEAGVMISLGTLPVGSCPAISVANGINEHGHIVGQSEIGTAFPNCFLNPVRWVNGVIEALPSGTLGTALDINESGDIVGNQGNVGSPQIATLWRSGQTISLGVLQGFTLSIASDINDAGVIVARSVVQPSPFRAYTVEVIPDNTAPSITIPGDITVNATGPDGAVVTFAASGDDAEDGSLSASCSPSSGATFGIGTTTVTCTVVDSGGLDASDTFTVTVLGANEQAEELYLLAAAAGPGGSLESKMFNVLQSMQESRAGVCGKLQAFINEVRAQSGKKISSARANAMIAAAQRIRAVIGC